MSPPDHGDQDEPTQTTPKGTPIPIPTRKQVADGLRRLVKPVAKPSGDDGSAEK